jgi:hypothetical protein
MQSCSRMDKCSCIQRELALTQTVSIGVREGKVYRLQGKPVGGSKGILDHGSMSVTEDEEQEAPKGEQSSQTSMLMFVASDRYFHIGFVSNMWKSSLIPLKT